ncbi:MAG TPA: (d)CMP kinase [Planctomycetaceae bacterium]|nr:(d)CMP kinase [Planctomycetaceae bacterium]
MTLTTTVITIDGPAGTGKSTVSRQLADRLGFEFLDTGAMYRCVAWRCLASGIDLNDSEQIACATNAMTLEFRADRCFVDEQDVTEEIRSSEVTAAASKVAVNPAVRARLVELQREWSHGRSLVTEGRDQGTVVFPDARLKLFLTAQPEIRAQRRFEQLGETGGSESYESILQQIRERDRRDEQREIAPLVPAPDALVIDTSGMSEDEVLTRLETEARKKLDR